MVLNLSGNSSYDSKLKSDDGPKEVGQLGGIISKNWAFKGLDKNGPHGYVFFQRS